MENRYAYQLNSNIYFDTKKFNKKHFCPQLELDQMDDIGELDETEKTSKIPEDTSEDKKKDDSDFPIWKKVNRTNRCWNHLGVSADLNLVLNLVLWPVIC